MSTDLCEVQILDSNLRESYGTRAHYSRDKAYRGQSAGIWRIINDPLNPPVPVIEKKPELILDKGKDVCPGLISIIIIALNNFKYTMTCIESIKKYTKNDYQIILVDNGSKDNTCQWFIENGRPDDILIRNQENKGFSIANNQALKIASGEYVLFLNNDTEIKEDDWIKPFMEGIKDADIIGPTMRKLVIDNHDYSFIFAGDGYDLDPFAYIEGWCLFGKKIVFDALGGMDEQFSPAYSEDADLSFKAIQAGFKLKKIDSVPIVHFGSKTSTQMPEMYAITVKNRKKLYRKWVSKKHANILIKREGAIGDVLMITPIVKALKKTYPESRLYVETQCPQLIENNPNIDEIIGSANINNFDLSYQLEYEKFPGEIRIDAMARQAGVKLIDRKMEVFLKEPQKLPINGPYVVFHTGKSWPNRELSIDKWADVAEYIKKQGLNIAEVGTSATERMSVDGITDFRNRQWGFVSKLIRDAEFFIGIDSACSNLAKAVQTPAFIFYGCVNPLVMLADVVEYPIIANNLDCIGCRDRSTAHYVECSKIETYCCTTIEVQDIIALIDQYIKKDIKKVA